MAADTEMTITDVIAALHDSGREESYDNVAADLAYPADRGRIDRRQRGIYSRPDRIVIPLTAGNINNNYIVVRKHLSFFPEDAVSKANANDGKGKPLTFALRLSSRAGEDRHRWSSPPRLPGPRFHRKVLQLPQTSGRRPDRDREAIRLRVPRRARPLSVFARLGPSPARTTRASREFMASSAEASMGASDRPGRVATAHGLLITQPRRRRGRRER
jgi:hypothetical protein